MGRVLNACHTNEIGLAVSMKKLSTSNRNKYFKRYFNPAALFLVFFMASLYLYGRHNVNFSLSVDAAVAIYVGFVFFQGLCIEYFIRKDMKKLPN